MTFAPDPLLGFEMTMLRMFAFNIAEPVSSASTTSSQTSSANLKTTASNIGAKPTAAPPIVPKPAQQPPVMQKTHADENDWPALVTAANLQGMLKQLAMNCSLTSFAQDKYVVAIDPSFENLLTKERGQQLQEALSACLNKKIVVEFTIKQVDVETPAMKVRREEQMRMDAAQKSLETDNNVKRIMDAFGATINTDTIQPGK